MGSPWMGVMNVLRNNSSFKKKLWKKLLNGHSYNKIIENELYLAVRRTEADIKNWIEDGHTTPESHNAETAPDTARCAFEWLSRSLFTTIITHFIVKAVWSSVNFDILCQFRSGAFARSNPFVNMAKIRRWTKTFSGNCKVGPRIVDMDQLRNKITGKREVETHRVKGRIKEVVFNAYTTGAPISIPTFDTSIVINSDKKFIRGRILKNLEEAFIDTKNPMQRYAYFPKGRLRDQKFSGHREIIWAYHPDNKTAGDFRDDLQKIAQAIDQSGRYVPYNKLKDLEVIIPTQSKSRCRRKRGKGSISEKPTMKLSDWIGENGVNHINKIFTLEKEGHISPIHHAMSELIKGLES